MRFTNGFMVIFIFLSITSIAAPLSRPTDIMRSVENVLEVRQLAAVADIASICAAALSIIAYIKSGIQEAESAFTVHVISMLGSQFPGKNVLIYHNQKSTVSLSPDAVHYHYELSLVNLGIVDFTQGYEIWVFDYGTFSLAGDGGYENWAIGGCFSGPSTDVVFTQCS